MPASNESKGNENQEDNELAIIYGKISPMNETKTPTDPEPAAPHPQSLRPATPPPATTIGKAGGLTVLQQKRMDIQGQHRTEIPIPSAVITHQIVSQAPHENLLTPRKPFSFSELFKAAEAAKNEVPNAPQNDNLDSLKSSMAPVSLMNIAPTTPTRRRTLPNISPTGMSL